MKKIISLFICTLLILSFSFHSYAYDNKYLVDDADLLTSDEESELLEEIENINTEHSLNVIIHTTYDTQGKEIYNYADDFYDNGDYAEDGIILVMDLTYRDYFVSTAGRIVDSLPNEIIESINSSYVSYLSSGEYYSAFTIFLQELSDHLEYEWMYTEVINDGSVEDYDGFYNSDSYYGNEYNYYSSHSNGFSISENLIVRELILIVIAVAAAVIITMILKKKMNTAVKKYDADDYVIPGSFNLEMSRDVFIGSNITKRPLPKNNNNHKPGGSGGGGIRVSGGGVRHGGAGGKF